MKLLFIYEASSGSLNIGSIILHGPHHSAHVSINTNLFSLSACANAWSKMSFRKTMDWEYPIFNNRKYRQNRVDRCFSLGVISVCMQLCSEIYCASKYFIRRSTLSGDSPFSSANFFANFAWLIAKSVFFMRCKLPA